MYKPDTLTRRGSLRSLRSAPLLSTVLESTLSLTRIHPIASLELPGLDYAYQSQTALGGALQHHRELGTSLRSGIAAITAASASAAGGGISSQSQSAHLLGRYGPNASIRHNERKIVQPKRVLSRKLKPHLVADTVKQYISRAQRTTTATSGGGSSSSNNKKANSQEQQNNMEFLRGVYAFMQVSRSSVDYNNGNNSNSNCNYNSNSNSNTNSGSGNSTSLVSVANDIVEPSPRSMSIASITNARTITKQEHKQDDNLQPPTPAYRRLLASGSNSNGSNISNGSNRNGSNSGRNDSSNNCTSNHIIINENNSTYPSAMQKMEIKQIDNTDS